MRKIKFYNSDNKVIAVSSFGEQPVKGVAKCDPDDTFSLEIGKELAEARCNLKVATKRTKYAKTKLDEATDAFNAAAAYLCYVNKYHTNAVNTCEEAQKAVDDILAKLV
jgi:hypothetical protein